MINNTIDTIRRNRAAFLRDIEYAREGVLEDTIDDRLEIASGEVETVEELREASNMCDKMDANEDSIAESAEIEKLLNADENLTFDEMIGIED